MKLTSAVQKLHDMGFDLSRAIAFETAWQVRCSQCEALVINGIPTHERTCPNARAAQEEEEGDV